MKRFVVILIILLAWTILQAQEPQLRFRHLTTNEGLSQNSVYCITEDSLGFMWFGTQDGLNRFDGNAFRVFRRDPDDPSSLASNRITALFEDSRGFLWIGTTEGLSRYDRRMERFARFRHDPKNFRSLCSNVITAIREDARGSLWIGTENGLNRFRVQAGDFDRFLHDPNAPDSLGGNFITCLHAAADGTLWIGTRDAGLDRLDLGRGLFSHHRARFGSEPGLKDDFVSSLCEDREGRLYIGTNSAGLACIDPRSGRWESYRSDPAKPYSLSSDSISCIIRGSSGNLWVSTANGGLNLFDLQGSRFYAFTSKPEDPWSLSHNTVGQLFETRSGILWAGTEGAGVNFHDPRTKAFGYFQLDPKSPFSIFNHISSFGEDSSGDIWVGTVGKGLSRLDRRTRKFTFFEPDPKNPFALPASHVMAIHLDRRGNLWIGTRGGGLCRYDQKKNRFLTYRHDPGKPDSLSHDYVYCILEEPDGELLVGTLEGFDRFYPDKGVFRHTLPVPGNRADPFNTIRDICRDRMSSLWMATPQGLICHDPRDGRFRFFQNDPQNPKSLSENDIRCLYVDGSGNLWVGTTYGLNRWLPDSQSFEHFTEKDGLPNSTIYGILEDEAENLWVSTNKGISRIHRPTRAVRSFDRSDGLQSDEFNTRACYKARNGELFFGGVNGFNSFFPALLTDDPTVPRVLISGFQVLNRSVPIGQKDEHGRVILAQSIGETREITLSHRDYIFSIEFVALQFSLGEKVRYAYQMEGLEENWNYVGNRRFVTYSTLPPGKYRFKVRASSVDGIWADDFTSLAITIIPPFWKTWWFLLLAGIVGIGAVVGIYRLRVSQLTRKKAELERLVALRTQELKEISLKDPLTGLRNRRFISEVLSEEISAFIKKKKYLISRGSTRRHHPDDFVYGMLMIDIDFFKTVNDRYGHDMGDQWLVQFAEVMRQNVRTDDEVIRFGGEEFLVVLKNTDPGSLNQLAAKMQRELAHIALFETDRDLSRTCSIGYTTFPFFTEQPSLLTFNETVMLADLGLYHAKKNGRNMIVRVVPGKNMPPSEDMHSFLTSLDFGQFKGYLAIEPSR